MRTIFMVVLMLLFFTSCKTSNGSIENEAVKSIQIANGGGFTGQIISYTIKDNGEVVRKNTMNAEEKVFTKLSKELTDQIFKNYEVLQLDSISLDSPGNMYFTITKTDGSKTHKLLWNSESEAQEIKTAKLFYQTVMNRIKKN